MKLLVPLLLVAASLSAGARDCPELIPGLPFPEELKEIVPGAPDEFWDIRETLGILAAGERELLSQWEALLSAHEDEAAARVDERLQIVRGLLEKLKKVKPVPEWRFYRDPETVRSEINEVRQGREERERRELELALWFAKHPAPDQDDDVQRAVAELGEVEMVIAKIEEEEKALQEKLRLSEQSPEYQFRLKVQNDRRRPTRDDVGGVWDSDPNLIGYTMVLEQKGKAVSGQGEFWGCTGVDDVFPITGTYADGILRLKFQRTEAPPSIHVFRFAPERGRPRFLVTDTANDPHPFPRSLLPTPKK